MVVIKTESEKAVDFSFMPSLKCNLSCAHCMYEAAPENESVLDFNRAKEFVATIDLNRINSFGFYGGEISADYDRYQKIIDLTTPSIPRFTITNGSWSRTQAETEAFVDFAERNCLNVFISQTVFHRPYQNQERMNRIAEEHGYSLKGDDVIIPMGRAGRADWDCGQRCLGYLGPMRLTMRPSGEIMFCNCDGVYPIVGSWTSDFGEAFRNGQRIEDVCPKLIGRIR
ncbi:hypothetical protein JW899_01515 [Candidatus Uhrbacteria bacterium]|nr:hypothetical protein [Candidatus Uhrbacteria bacterium]